MKNTKGENENINTPEDRSNVYTEVVEYLKTIDDDEKLEKLPMEFVDLLKKKLQNNPKSGWFLLWHGCSTAVRLCQSQKGAACFGSRNRNGNHSDPAGSKNRGFPSDGTGDSGKKCGYGKAQCALQRSGR